MGTELESWGIGVECIISKSDCDSPGNLDASQEVR